MATIKANPIGTVAEQKAAGNTFNTMTGQRLDSAPTSSNTNSYNMLTGAKLGVGESYNFNGQTIKQGTPVVPTMPENTTVNTGIIAQKGTPVFPINTQPDINTFTGITNGLNTKVQALTLQQQQDAENMKLEQSNNDRLDALLGNKPESSANMWQQAQNELQITEKKNLVTNLTNQLGQITSRGQALQQQVVGQGRGIPEAIIGGQQAQFARETAIQALPVSAQLSAAQGDLDSAKEDLNTLYKLKSEDATRQYEYKNKVIDSFYDFADKQSQAKLSNIKTKQEWEHQDLQSNIKNQRDMAQMAYTNGQSSLGAQISKLEPTSPTYKNDLAALTSQLRDTKRELELRLLSEQIKTETAKRTGATEETATQAKERQDKEKIAAQKKAQLPIVLEKIDNVNKLLTHSGLNTRVGPAALGLPTRTFFGARDSFGAGDDFAATVQQLTNQDTLATLLELKAAGGTLGAVSEKELDLLQKAASKINAWEKKDSTGKGKGEWKIDEKSFKEELNKVLTSSQNLYKELGGILPDSPEAIQLKEENKAKFGSMVDGALEVNGYGGYQLN